MHLHPYTRSKWVETPPSDVPLLVKAAVRLERCRTSHIGYRNVFCRIIGLVNNEFDDAQAGIVAGPTSLGTIKSRATRCHCDEIPCPATKSF